MKANTLRKGIAWFAALCLFFGSAFSAAAHGEITPTDGESRETVSDVGVEEGALGLSCQSAVLMEATTGAVLYTQNPNQALPPASVTKIMTLLLVMEALDGGIIRPESPVTVSANAASMGGSQIYLKEGEQMSVEELLKSVVIASANDAAVALAEYLCGSVPVFVEKMNAKAKQLGMKDTFFENVTGLDDTAERHLTSAYDIALMSRELIRHEMILQYSSIWMDTIRDGAFGLTNTNRLVRFYPGCTGLKTGSTSKAGFCVSVTAEREELSLICVIMGAESRDVRNAAATQLLDWGFANYALYRSDNTELGELCVTGGTSEKCRVGCSAFACVVPKSELSDVRQEITLPESVAATVRAADRVGSIRFLAGERVLGELPIIATETVERINFFQIFRRNLARFLLI
ncbi:MAG: D-alanyl-D-alanine carboxypeptidase [Clostridia bacterium]|nr:D-alanyl-D-alanine carboxypeptidase [Clostridia bacterium]